MPGHGGRNLPHRSDEARALAFEKYLKRLHQPSKHFTYPRVSGLVEWETDPRQPHVLNALAPS